MVGAAGVMVAQSATKEDGLVNQAFKITVLVALALSIGVGIFLIWKLTGWLSVVGSASFSIWTVAKSIFYTPALSPLTFIFGSWLGRSGK